MQTLSQISTIVKGFTQPHVVGALSTFPDVINTALQEALKHKTSKGTNIVAETQDVIKKLTMETMFPRFYPDKCEALVNKAFDLPSLEWLRTCYYYGVFAKGVYSDGFINYLLNGWCKTQNWIHLLAVQTSSNVDTPRYIYAVDHAMKTLLIVIRGTSEGADVLADLKLNEDLFTPDAPGNGIATYEVFKAEENGQDLTSSVAKDIAAKRSYTAHLGFNTAAKNVLKLNIKDATFDSIYRQASEELNIENPRIVVTGHSYGAATALMVFKHLRLAGKDVYCVAFAPPPCVSAEMYHDDISNYNQRCISFVNRWDIVPRGEAGCMRRGAATLKMSTTLLSEWSAQFSIPNQLSKDEEFIRKQARDFLKRTDTTDPNNISNDGTVSSEVRKEMTPDLHLRFSAEHVKLIVPGRIYWIHSDHDFPGVSADVTRNMCMYEVDHHFLDKALIMGIDSTSIVNRSQLFGDHSMTEYLRSLNWMMSFHDEK